MKDFAQKKKLAQTEYMENEKERAKMKRNEDKFANSYSSYEQLNKKCFETMTKVLANRFKIITPTVGRVVSLMQMLYASADLSSQNVSPPKESPVSKPVQKPQPK